MNKFLKFQVNTVIFKLLRLKEIKATFTRKIVFDSVSKTGLYNQFCLSIGAAKQSLILTCPIKYDFVVTEQASKAYHEVYIEIIQKIGFRNFHIFKKGENLIEISGTQISLFYSAKQFFPMIL